MKKQLKRIVSILTVLITLFNYSGFAQEFECSVDDAETFPLLNNDGLNCPISSSPVDELPDLEIKVNVHFIARPDGRNFYPGSSDDWSTLNGNKYAELLIDDANNKLENLLASPTSLANFLGSTKYHYKIFTDPNNPNDLYSGVWYWNSMNEFSSNVQYGSDVFNIIIKDKGAFGYPVFSGLGCWGFCNQVILEGAYNNSATQAHLENFEPQLMNWNPVDDDGEFTVITNPDNVYSKVGQYTKGIVENSTLSADLPFVYGLNYLGLYPKLSMKLKAPSGAVDVKMILHSPTQGDKSVIAAISSTGAWVDIVFDFSAYSSISDFERISLIFDPNTFNPDAVYLFDELKYVDKTYWGFWGYSNILNHEVGHNFGLCHSFSPDETCSDIDLVAESNCNSGGASTASCGSLPSSGCNPWDSGSLNMMGYNTANQALTPCQWDKIYTGLIEHYPAYVKCEPLNETLVIPSGADVTWDYLKLINQDVVVEPDAKLTITCEVRMGHDRHILVERGAQLIVDGGKITSLCRHFWNGIVVAGNREKEQPDAPYFNQELDDAGIVLIKNHSIIKHASVGVRASGDFHSPWSENAARWGGLIIAEHSTFVDNKKAVAFYSYDFPNKSSFKFCEFKEDGEFYDGTVGVTVWDCDGITFERNRFENFDLSGILGIDYSAKVKDANIFSNNTRGIESFATHPFASYLEVGDETATPNIFEDNVESHIFSNGNDGPNGLKVIRNEFYNGQFGVWVDGASVYDINRNWFNNQQSRSVNLFRTGNGANYVSCNSYYGTPVGLAFFGKNGRTQFLDNTFAPPISLNTVDIAISNIGAEKGQVQSFIGTWTKPASNCFSSATDISAIPSETVPFYYFYSGNSSGGTCHYLPLDNLSDGGVNNYFVNQSFGSASPCPKKLKGSLFSLDKLVTKRAIFANKKAQFDANPENVQMALDYYDAYQEKDEVLISLVKQAIDNHNYQEADVLLAGENTIRAEQWRFGLALEAGDYGKAKLLLDLLGNNDEINQDFIKIQAINMERLTTPGFILTTEQNTFLHETAEGLSASRGYAQAILALLTGERFQPFAPIAISGLSNSSLNGELSNEKEVIAEPNPTSGWTTFSWDKTGYTSLVVNNVFTGTIVTNQVIDPQSTSIQLDLTTLSGTFYSIRLEGDNKTPIYGRMIKSRE